MNKGLPKSEKINPSDWYTNVDPETQKNLNDLIWTQVDKFAEQKATTKEQRYALAGHAYEVATRERRPVHTKAGMFRSLLAWSKKQYEIESGKDLTSDVGDDEVATVFKDFKGI